MENILAGDKGVTLDLSRRFNNGFTLGVFATKTNLSAEEFGEGSSFDKGFYFFPYHKCFLLMILDWKYFFWLHPLTKDGGAMLIQLNSSYCSLLGDTNKILLKRLGLLMIDTMKKIAQIFYC